MEGIFKDERNFVTHITQVYNRMLLLEGVDDILMKGCSSFCHHFLVQCLLENKLPINVC